MILYLEVLNIENMFAINLKYPVFNDLTLMEYRKNFLNRKLSHNYV